MGKKNNQAASRERSPNRTIWKDMELFSVLFELCSRDEYIKSFEQLFVELNNYQRNNGQPPTPQTSARASIKRLYNQIICSGRENPEDSETLALQTLFSQNGQSIKPTADAVTLHQQVRNLLRTFRSACQEFAASKNRNVVNIGTTKTVGLEIVSAIFSHLGLLPKFDISVSLISTKDIAAKINQGQIDIAITYGPHGPETLDNGIAYEPLSDPIHLVAISHPEFDIRLIQENREIETDIKSKHPCRQYVTARSRLSRHLENLTYDSLPAIDPLAIAIGDKSKFAYTSYSKQPSGFDSIINTVKTRYPERIVEFQTNDECLLFTRMNNAISIVPQSFARRTGILAYRLQTPHRPENNYTTSIGCYNIENRNNENTEIAIRAIKLYFEKFKDGISSGLPYSLGDSEYNTWANETAPALANNDSSRL